MNIKNLEELDIKEEEIRTLIFLLENPSETAGGIAKKLSIARTSLYLHLQNLIEKGLVSESQKNGVKTFTASPIEKVRFVFEERKRKIIEAEKEFEKIFEEAKVVKPAGRPKLQTFEGAKQMRNLSRDFLLSRNSETESYWPIKLMLEVLGEDFFKEFNKERIKRNIWVNAIWPENQRVDMEKYPFMGIGDEFLREIRIAPKPIDFSMGYWIYENKVAFISSRKSNFGFIIENDEFADMVRSQFKVMWHLSKPIRVKEDTSKKLFKRMMSE